ncbi:caspase domain-containing protein [Gongronella butleri]|nr:caspase domain-containing protein [Gongronella butleri]
MDHLKKYHQQYKQFKQEQQYQEQTYQEQEQQQYAPPPPANTYPTSYGQPLDQFQDPRRQTPEPSYVTSSRPGDDLYLHVNPNQSEAPEFKLSSCQGRKRALLIGINYFGSKNQLNGCINDVHNVKSFLIERFNFKEEDMVILTDDKQDPKFIPTRANIISACNWLVRDADDDDSFFFHYSGHGGSVQDVSGDEDDGFDETIYPVDFESYEGESGQIIDDDLHAMLVKPLPKGCRLTCIFDSCHSGTVLDLPYVYSTKGTIKQQNLFKDAGMGLLSAGIQYATTGQKDKALSSLMALGKQMIETKRTESANRERNSSTADVVMFSGCKDDQTSADASEAGKATGAMSYAFIRSFREHPQQTYLELLNNVRDILREKYSQRPQFSCSHPLDVNIEFIC